MRMPTRPSASPAQKRSGRSVYCTRGNAVAVSSMIYSSILPVESTASISMRSSRACTRSTREGSTTPSRYSTSTVVTDCRPTICSRRRSSGAFRWRRHRLVLVRTDSTKESRGPLSTVSFSGSLMERFSSVPTLKDKTSVSPGNSSRQLPSTRSKAARSVALRRSTPRL